MAADPSFSDEILQTISGTTTAWLPISTPWVSIQACSSQMYAGPGGAVIAFDPYYGTNIATSQTQCLPPEATLWWNPPSDGKTVYVLGPTFVCPAAYSAVQTLLVNSATQEILCCPTSFSLNAIVTHNPRTDFPSQCVSSCTNGESITYQTQSVVGGPWSLFTRGIQSDPFTVYAVHVNGYNVVATTTSSSSSSSSSTASPSSSPSSAAASTTTSSLALSTASESPSTSSTATNTSSELSGGAAAGIGIGAAAAIIIVAALAFWFYQRRRVNRKIALNYAGVPAMELGTEGPNNMAEYPGGGSRRYELPAKNRQLTYELH